MKKVLIITIILWTVWILYSAINVSMVNANEVEISDISIENDLTSVNSDQNIEATTLTNVMVEVEPAVAYTYWTKDLWNGKIEVIWEYVYPWAVVISDDYKSYIKIKTKKENVLKTWDKIKMIIEWTLKSFRIKSLEVNWVDLYKQNIVEKVKIPEYWVFNISWKFDWSYIYSKYGKIRLKLSQVLVDKYKDKEIEITVKWTIKSFKVLSVK